MPPVHPKHRAAVERCQTDLFFLMTEVLYPHDAHKYGDFHRWMCREVNSRDIWFEPNGKSDGRIGTRKYLRPSVGDRQLWLVPRDHFKTSILTIGHAIQQILRNPNVSLLLLSGKDEHALLFSDEIRRQFTFNERLGTIFGPWMAKTMDEMGSKGEWTIPAKAFFGGKRREPTMVATGFKSRLESRHYDGGYLDDCMGEDDTSEVGLREVRENYKKVIPLIDSDGWIMMPGTRKHYNDLYQGLMDTETYRVYVRHGLEHPTKACDADECSRSALPHKAADMKIGVALEPARMKRDDYARKLAECQIDPKQGQSYFWHEYMNIPFSPADRKFQPAWFVRIDDSMIPGKMEPFAPLTKYISIDSAWKDEEHPSGYDFTAIGVGGFDDFARLYILDIFRDRNWTVKQGMQVIVSAMKLYGISHVIYQKVGEQTWPGDLRDACRRAGIPLVPIILTRGGRGADSKFQHVLKSQGSFESGRVFFRKSVENFDDLVNEFCNLGRWTNDDMADMIGNFFDERVRAQAPRPESSAAVVNTGYRPMPYDGAFRRSAFSQNRPSPLPDYANFGRNGQIAVDSAGNPLFTPDQVALFSERTDKTAAVIQPSFRPLR